VAERRVSTVTAKIRGFRSSTAFRKWLAANHGRTEGIWLRIFKKASGRPSITYAEALDEALCFGWIDGLKHSHDELSWLQKFTPRRPRSGWSKINTQHAERLIRAGQMQPPGRAQVEAAKNDGRWTAAYHSSMHATFPDDFLTALGKNKSAKAFFDTRLLIGCRLPRGRKPDSDAWKRFWECCAGASHFTRTCRAKPPAMEDLPRG
jgi:uncharacterized protein YdeI (YjbR/CyaY-like superfamily)